MLLKGALHVHTTCSDGEMTLFEVVRAHEALGFDFIALTDHDFLLRPECYEEVKTLSTDLMILRGIEMTVFAKGYVHVNRIQGVEDVLHVFNHPEEMGLPVKKAMARILEVAERIPLDAVEVTTKGFHTPEYDVDALPFSKVATDDSHNALMIGRAWVELDCKKDPDSIIRSIRFGDFWNCFA